MQLHLKNSQLADVTTSAVKIFKSTAMNPAKYECNSLNLSPNHLKLL